MVSLKKIFLMHFESFGFPWLELLEFLLQKGRDCGLLFLYPQWLTLSTDLFPDLLLLLIYSYDTHISLLVKPRPMCSLAHRSFFLMTFFQNSFRFTAELNRKFRDFPYTLPYSCITSSIINIFHYSDTFVTVDVPILDHSKIMVYIMVHSWCYILQILTNDMYPPLIVSHRNSFTALKILCGLPVHPSFFLNLWQALIFLLFPQFCTLQNVT